MVACNGSRVVVSHQIFYYLNTKISIYKRIYLNSSLTPEENSVTLLTEICIKIHTRKFSKNNYLIKNPKQIGLNSLFKLRNHVNRLAECCVSLNNL